MISLIFISLFVNTVNKRTKTISILLLICQCWFYNITIRYLWMVRRRTLCDSERNENVGNYSQNLYFHSSSSLSICNYNNFISSVFLEFKINFHSSGYDAAQIRYSCIIYLSVIKLLELDTKQVIYVVSCRLKKLYRLFIDKYGLC